MLPPSLPPIVGQRRITVDRQAEVTDSENQRDRSSCTCSELCIDIEELKAAHEGSKRGRSAEEGRWKVAAPGRMCLSWKIGRGRQVEGCSARSYVLELEDRQRMGVGRSQRPVMCT